MSDGILSDRAIMAGVREKSIVIDPFDADNLNPASYDVTLGDGVCVYSRWVGDPSGPDMPWRKDGSRLYAKNEVLDVSEEPQTMSYVMNAKDGTMSPAMTSTSTELSIDLMNEWIHGHTHDSVDYEIGATRVVCNPFGYKNKKTNHEFDPKKIVTVHGG